MSKIDDAKVHHVAMLSRLKLSDAQIHQFAGQLSDILGYVDKLAELNVEGVEPMAHAAEVSNVFRSDEPGPGLSVDKALANAPDKMDGFFRVVKVLGDGGGA